MILLRIGISYTICHYEPAHSKWESRTHQNEESLEDIEQLAGTAFVASLHALADNSNHSRQKTLEHLL